MADPITEAQPSTAAPEAPRDEWALPTSAANAESARDASKDAVPPPDPSADLLARLGDLPDEALEKLLAHERVQKRVDDKANANASRQIDRKQKELEAGRLREQQNQQSVTEAREWRETVHQARPDNPNYEEREAALTRMHQTQWAQIIRDEAANSPQVLERSAAVVVAGLFSQLAQLDDLKDLPKEAWQQAINAAQSGPNAGAVALWELAKAKFADHLPKKEVDRLIELARGQERDELRKLGISPDLKRSDAVLGGGNGVLKPADIKAMSSEEFLRAGKNIWDMAGAVRRR